MCICTSVCLYTCTFCQQNPSQVGVALQVFYNLDQLSTTLLSIIGGFREAIQHDIQNALDPATLIQGVEGTLSLSLPPSLSTPLSLYPPSPPSPLSPPPLTLPLPLAPSGGGPGRSTLPAIGSSATWKAALWTRLDRLVNSILKAYGQIHQLYLVLTKKRDPITQVSFMESIAEVQLL